MAVYYVLLIAIVGLGLWLGKDNSKGLKRGVYVGVISLSLALVIGLRYGIGFDYTRYIPLFEEIDSLAWSNLFAAQTEIGFTVLSKLLMLISNDLTFLYMCYALLMMGIVGVVIYRHSEIPWISFFAFVTLAFLGSSMNYVRQTMAAIIYLLAIPSLQKRKIIPYMLLVLLASSFHKTALLLIVVYFIANLPLNKITAGVYAGGTLMIFLFSDYLMSFVMRFAFSGYQGINMYYDGSSFSYVMLLIALAAVVVLRKKQLLEMDEKNLVYINLMIYGAFFELMMVRHFIMERFALYFMIQLLITLPLTIRTFEPRLEEPVHTDGKFRSEKAKAQMAKRVYKERRQTYHAIVVAICAVCFVHFLIGVNFKFHNVYPYYSIFSEEAKNHEEILYYPYGSDKPLRTTEDYDNWMREED